ncbi:hypothetical protein A7C91_05090 [Thermococcus piezophilus]|uniref:Uncharacterized protein n=1 Tax=Thermococcus piezophilus TaxID=1712654 RepID=A0A172WGP5_9EURY|nr:hypothetical protein A7C91_05090 [Thermococcus piezophilus]
MRKAVLSSPVLLQAPLVAALEDGSYSASLHVFGLLIGTLMAFSLLLLPIFGARWVWELIMDKTSVDSSEGR